METDLSPTPWPLRPEAPISSEFDEKEGTNQA